MSRRLLVRELERVQSRICKLTIRSLNWEREKLVRLKQHASTIAKKLSAGNAIVLARVQQTAYLEFWSLELDRINVRIAKLASADALTVDQTSKLVTLKACAKGITAKIEYWTRFNFKMDTLIDSAMAAMHNST